MQMYVYTVVRVVTASLVLVDLCDQQLSGRAHQIASVPKHRHQEVSCKYTFSSTWTREYHKQLSTLHPSCKLDQVAVRDRACAQTHGCPLYKVAAVPAGLSHSQI